MCSTLTKTACVLGLVIGTFAIFDGAFVCLSVAAQDAGGRLTVAVFDKLHRKLTKMSTERVWSIPWQLSVRKAREIAAEENKPVFLWISSNGGTHPLGPC